MDHLSTGQYDFLTHLLLFFQKRHQKLRTSDRSFHYFYDLIRLHKHKHGFELLPATSLHFYGIKFILPCFLLHNSPGHLQFHPYYILPLICPLRARKLHASNSGTIGLQKFHSWWIILYHFLLFLQILRIVKSRLLTRRQTFP